MRLSSHAGSGQRPMSSHESGGGWPGGAGGLPPGPFGVAKSLFGNGTPYGTLTGTYTYDSGIWTVTGAAIIAVDAETGAAILAGKQLIVDGGTLTVATSCKGLLAFMSEKIEVKNGGRIHIDKLGKAGNFGNLTPYALLPESLKGKFKQSALEAYVALGEGAAGTPAYYEAGYNNGTLPATPTAAGAMQSGGGGQGTWFGGQNNTLGAGGKGGPCCGGAGSGGVWASSAAAGLVCPNAGNYGGPGGTPYPSGYSSAGGAGDPGGTGLSGGANGPGAGGGLLMLFCPSASIASGCIVSSDGSIGGSGGASGASAGGGIICIVTRSGGYTNNGTVRAAGGPTVQCQANGSYYSGAGGAGSVNIFTA